MPGRAETILVVEDEQAIASFVAAYLRKDGFDVRMTASGREALSLVGSDPPSLVVLDLMLPDLDGMEVCRRIRETSTADVHIRQMRRKLGDAAPIVTVWGIGYKAAPVRDGADG